MTDIVAVGNKHDDYDDDYDIGFEVNRLSLAFYGLADYTWLLA